MKTRIYANLLSKIYSKSNEEETMKKFITEILNDLPQQLAIEINESIIIF
jgi:hypothetical protein